MNEFELRQIIIRQLSLGYFLNQRFPERLVDSSVNDYYLNNCDELQRTVISNFNHTLNPFNLYQEYQQLLEKQVKDVHRDLDEIRHSLETTQEDLKLNDDEVNAIIQNKIDKTQVVPPVLPPDPPPPTTFEKIQEFIQKTRKKVWQWIKANKFISLILLALLVIILAIAIHNFFNPTNGNNPTPSPSPSVSPVSNSELEKRIRISFGEKPLIPNEKTNRPAPIFRKAQENFQNKNFSQAQKDFHKVRTGLNQNDPEALIYENNSIAKQHDYVSIVVSVPISRSPNNALGLLRGVAMVQNDINQGKNKKLINEKYLLVKIADDGNDPNTANLLSAQFISDPDILAVQGHNRSDVSKQVAQTYNQGRLVMISPTSTTTTLRDTIDKQDHTYIYRVVPTDQDLAERLRKYMDDQGIRNEKVYVCMDKEASNTKAFLSAFFNNDKKKTDCDLSDLVKAKNSIENDFLKGDKFSTLLLLPSTNTDNALKITEPLKDYPEKGLFGNDVMFTDIPNSIKDNKNIMDVINQRLTIVAPWHPQANKSFTQTYNELWSNPNAGSDGLNWRTGMAYDAALAITEAIRKASLTSDIRENRQAVAKALQSVNIEGATKTIQFTEDGDRDVSVAPKGYIVQFDKNANKETYRSDFVCIEGCDQSTALNTEPQ